MLREQHQKRGVFSFLYTMVIISVYFWTGKPVIFLTFHTSLNNYEEVLNKKYQEVDNISVDFGIMEKADNIYVIPGSFGWDDVGSWNAVIRYRKSDCNNNICMGEKVINIDGRNNIAVSNGKPIIIAGISDAFVVESDEAIVITNKENLGNIKNIRSSLG